MIIPFIPEDLFELNNDLYPQFDGEAIIIDNIFKNYNNILDICRNTSAESWKVTPTSRNFKDYYDCKPTFVNYFKDEKKLNNRKETFFNLINHYYNNNSKLEFEDHFTFNYFKHLNKNLPKHFQHHPHYDSNFNIIFYIDSFENGGTAIYENVSIDNDEHENLIKDISSFSIKKIIRSKPNRCVIFPGNNLHGGYIENHNIYYDNWRINLVNFIKSTTND